MPEQLQPVLDFIQASFMVSNAMLIQGVIIAVVLGFIMPKGIHHFIIFPILALVIDKILVPAGKGLMASGWDFAQAGDLLMMSANDAIAGDPVTNLGQRAVFFLIALIVVRVIRKLIGFSRG